MRKVIPGETDLATVNPELAAEWHPTKNGILTPADVSKGTEKKAWWTCSVCGNEWEASIYNRNKGSGCPKCGQRKSIDSRSKNLVFIKGSLATNVPELAQEWHPALNGELTAEMVTSMSNKTVWWQCQKGHEWQATISSRSLGDGCPFCSGHRILIGFNDLATKNPELSAEWHPTKNGNLTARSVAPGSGRKIWWLCPICGHEWDAIVASRAKGHGCPVCGKREARISRTKSEIEKNGSLKECFPEIAAEWHPSKNEELTPDMINAGSHKKVWWQCVKCRHEWQAIIESRTKNHGCPVCGKTNGVKKRIDTLISNEGSLKTHYPELAAEWHPTKNGDLTPEMFTPRSGRKVWWQCQKGHEWQGVIGNRTKGVGCPVCASEQQTSFPEKVVLYYTQKIFPDTLANVKKEVFSWLGAREFDIYVPSLRLAVEYDGPLHTQEKDQQKNDLCSRNGITLVRIRSHELQYLLVGSIDIDLVDKSVDSLTFAMNQFFHFVYKRYGTKYDVDINIERDRIAIMELLKLQEKKNSLDVLLPELAAQWHSTKNGTLLPSQVTKGSNRKVWWQCPNGHEWEAVISSRTYGHGCPICAGNRVLVGYNDLKFKNPDLAAEWHPSKNGALTPEMVTCGSNKKVWWIGKCGHEWQAAISSRSHGNGCPICAPKKSGETKRKHQRYKEEIL